jgi:Sec-independent protein translocase protein TatA
MSLMTIGIIVIVAVVIYGAKKLIEYEDFQNDRPDTIRDNSTKPGIQEIKKTRDT